MSAFAFNNLVGNGSMFLLNNFYILIPLTFDHPRWYRYLVWLKDYLHCDADCLGSWGSCWFGSMAMRRRNCCRADTEAWLRKELEELREFTRYEKDLRDASILQHQEVRWHFTV